LGLALLAGCARAVTVEGTTVSARQVAYAFGPIPAAWERVRVPDDDAAWLDPPHGAVVHVDHTCERSQDAPLRALVQHLLIGFTDRHMVTEEDLPLDGRTARHVVVRARLDGVARMLEFFVLKKDGCVFDLGYAAPPERFEDGRGAFQAFVRGFRTTRTPLSDGP
jgi:hypothetical protein